MSGGGKNNRVPLLTGVHHVTVPTSDPLAAGDWYVRVFDFAALLMEERENEVVAVCCCNIRAVAAAVATTNCRPADSRPLICHASGVGGR
jgi:hypothetical protein